MTWVIRTAPCDELGVTDGTLVVWATAGDLAFTGDLTITNDSGEPQTFQVRSKLRTPARSRYVCVDPAGGYLVVVGEEHRKRGG